MWDRDKGHNQRESTLKSIVVVSKDAVTKEIIEKSLAGEFTVFFFDNIISVLDFIYNSIPDLIIIDGATDDLSAVNILNNLKGDPIFKQLSVLAIFHDSFEIPGWNDLLVEDYLRRSHLEREIHSRATLSIARSERVVEINPLTRLPGNISINRQIQDRLDRGEIFSLAYVDIDNFKPFNDYYGFSRGDEVLRATGRLILNIVKSEQQNNSFVGHIGGDDFVYIMDFEAIERASEVIVKAFDNIIPTFYDSSDRERDFILSTDRQGNKKAFSMMSISIGIATNRFFNFSHFGEITEIASKMKAQAKKTNNSCYRMDRRFITYQT